MARQIYGNFETETKRHPLFAGMDFNGSTQTYKKIRKVGYKVIETTFDVNPEWPDDRMIVSEREIKRVIK